MLWYLVLHFRAWPSFTYLTIIHTAWYYQGMNLVVTVQLGASCQDVSSNANLHACQLVSTGASMTRR